MTNQLRVTTLLCAAALLSGCGNAVKFMDDRLAPVEERATPVGDAAPPRNAALTVERDRPAKPAASTVYAHPELASAAPAPQRLEAPTPSGTPTRDATRTPAPATLPAPAASGAGVPARPGVVPEPPASPAARALVARGQTFERAGQHEQAAASYERALEIAPGDPWLWHRLASVRAAQGQSGLARALARRSNALGAGDPAIERANAGFM